MIARIDVPAGLLEEAPDGNLGESAHNTQLRRSGRSLACEGTSVIMTAVGWTWFAEVCEGLSSNGR